MICVHCEEETEEAPCDRCGADPLVDGRYVLLRVLGRGANGTTYGARRLEDDQMVALKELLVRRAASLKNLELFEREARTLRQLDHPGIPEHLEEFTVDQGPNVGMYIAQELVSGDALSKSLDDAEPLDANAVLEVVAEVGKILHYLHGLTPPVVHRDIKPQNLVHGRRVYLVDFGAVQEIAGVGGDGVPTMAGTVGYMPPEQLRGQASPASDIYALGMTAIALLTGRPPTTNADIDWTVGTSEATRALLKSMTALAPENRPDANAVVKKTEAAQEESQALMERAAAQEQALAKVDHTPRKPGPNFTWGMSYGLTPILVPSAGGVAFAALISTLGGSWLLAAAAVVSASVAFAGFGVAKHRSEHRRMELYEQGTAVVGRIFGVGGYMTFEPKPVPHLRVSSTETDHRSGHYHFHWEGQRYNGRFGPVRSSDFVDGGDILILVDPSNPSHHAPYCTFVENLGPMP